MIGLLAVPLAALTAGLVPSATATAAPAQASPARSAPVAAPAAPSPAAPGAAQAHAAKPPAINKAAAQGAHGIVYRVGVRPHPSPPPKSSQPAARSASNRTPSTNPICSPCDPPLLFSGGSPVMGGTSTPTPGTATITPVYWAPTGFNFPGNYQSLIDTYLHDVQVASAANNLGNVWGIATQYYQNLGAGDRFINFKVTAGTEIDIPAATSFPAQSLTTGCVADSGFSACVTDGGLQSMLSAYLNSHSLPQDDSHLYMVFFPPNVETCQFNGSTSSNSDQCSTNVYCGYHSAFFQGNNPTIYANMPYADLFGCADPYNGAQAPNGNSFADAEISIISHEANESVTDWDGAWFDNNGFENGDECAYVYGSAMGSPGTLFNQVINGHDYYTQDEFSNADYFNNRGDVNSPTDPNGIPLPFNQQVNGCLQQPNLPGIGSLSADSVIPGTSVTVGGLGLGSTAGTAAMTPAGGGSPIALTVTSWSTNAVTVTIDPSQALGSYNLALTTSGSTTTNSLAIAVAKPYTPLTTPVRLFDTRPGFGGGGPVGAGIGGAISARVAGVDGVPAAATAVALNITAIGATAPTYITAWPDGVAKPTASNLNVNNGQPIPNFDIAAIGLDGNIDFYNNAGSVNLVADIAGYYITSPQYTPVTPVRLLETRPGFGGAGPVLAGDANVRSVPTRGVDGVPMGATAVALNITAIGATAPTYITAWPEGTGPRPTASNLNVNSGQPVPNFDIVSLTGSDGNIDFYNNAGSVNLVADIAGYFSAGNTYTPLAPVRLFDTRPGFGGQGPVGPGPSLANVLHESVAGVHGVALTATAVALNITAIGATAPTYVTAWPDGKPKPTVSNLNVNNSLPVPNFAIVTISPPPDGKIDFYNNAGKVNLFADIAGYFS
jgi:hypothetical protein